MISIFKTHLEKIKQLVDEAEKESKLEEAHKKSYDARKQLYKIEETISSEEGILFKLKKELEDYHNNTKSLSKNLSLMRSAQAHIIPDYARNSNTDIKNMKEQLDEIKKLTKKLLELEKK